MMTARMIFAAGLALAIVAPAGMAQAESPLVETRSIAVRASDLDLTSSAGAAALKSRVSRAATRICGRTTASVQANSQIQRCRAAAIASAQPQVEIAMERAKSGVRYADAGTGVSVTGSN